MMSCSLNDPKIFDGNKNRTIDCYFSRTTGVLQTVLSYVSSVVLKAVILIGCLKGLGVFLIPGWHLTHFTCISPWLKNSG